MVVQLACDIYKSGIRLASGLATHRSRLISGVERIVDRNTPEVERRIGQKRNVQVTITEPGWAQSQTYNTRVAADTPDTVTVVDFCPFDGVTPPWVSGGSIPNNKTWLVEGTKTFLSQNADQVWSARYHTVYDHLLFETRLGDFWAGDGVTYNRSELYDTITRPEGTEFWVAYSFMIEANEEFPVSQSELVVLGQMHDATLANNPTLAFEVRGTLARLIYRDSPVDVDTPAVVSPLDGTTPTLALSFRQRLLTSYGAGSLYRVSAGTSIDRLYDQTGTGTFGSASGGTQPTVVNTGGVITANFDGIDDGLITLPALSAVVTAAAHYMIVRFKVNAIGPTVGDVWNNDTLIGDSGNFCGIALYGTFVVPYVDQGGSVGAWLNIPVTTGVWHTIESRHEGGVLYGRLNGGSWSSIACTDIGSMTGTMRVGRGSTGSTWFNGEISDVAVYNSALNDTLRDQIQARIVSGAVPAIPAGYHVAYSLDPIQRGVWYNAVIQFKAGHSGVGTIFNAWLNGVQVADYDNIPLGLADSVGHYWKFGIYRKASGDTLTVRYANVEVGSASLAARVDNPLPLNIPRVAITPPLDNTNPSWCGSFKRRLLSTYGGTLYRLSTATLLDRLYDQSVGAIEAAGAGAAQPTLNVTDDVTTATFTGDDQMTSLPSTGVLMGADTGYFIVRFKVTSITVPGGTSSWNYDTLIGDASGFVGVSFRQPNICICYINDNVGDCHVDLTFTLNTWHTVEHRHEGGLLYGRIDGGEWTSVATGNIGNISAAWKLGCGQSGTEFIGAISDVGIYPTALDETARDAIQTAFAT